jgi:hypothetical protein
MGIIATLVSAAMVTMGALTLPSLRDATRTVDLVNLLAKANTAQQALATELNEITMAGVTGREPDQALTDKAMGDLEKAGSPLLSSLPLPADEFGRRAEALLEDAQARVDRARYFSERGYNTEDKDVVQFTTLIEDVDTIVEKIPQDTPDRDIKNEVQEYLTQIRGLPVPVIAEGIEDNRGIRIQELADEAKSTVGGPRTLVFVYFGLAGLFAVLAAVWYVMYVLRRRTASSSPEVPATPKAVKPPKEPKKPKKTKESEKAAAAPVEVSATPSTPGAKPAAPATPATPKVPATLQGATGGLGKRPGVPASRPAPASAPAATGSGTAGPASSGASGASRGIRPTPTSPPRPSGSVPTAPPGFARQAASAPTPDASAPPADAPDATAKDAAPDETKPVTPKAPGPRIPWRTTKPTGGGSPS